MSHAKPGPGPELRCWDCGAENDRGASECWLCQRVDWGKYPGMRRSSITRPQTRMTGPLASISGLMVLIAMVAVFSGLFLAAPGLAVALLVCALPAWGITEAQAYRRRRRGESMSGAEKALRIIGLTILIPVLLIVALAAALFVICSSAGPQSNPAVVITVVAIVVILAFGFLIAAFIRS